MQHAHAQLGLFQWPLLRESRERTLVHDNQGSTLVHHL